MVMAGSSDAYLIGGAVYPEDMGVIGKIYRNVEDEPLIRKIKLLEKQLPDDFADREETTGQEKKVLEDLLNDFKQLLQVKYGALGYLVSTTSEEIIHLYGVDTDRDFVFLEGGSSIRVPNEKLDPVIEAGGGRRWMGERGFVLYDPEETPANRKMTDEAVKEIIAAIKDRLNAS